MLLAPLVVPVVIVAVGVYFSFAKFGLVDGYLGLMLAHAALGAPFVLVTVLSTLAGFDRNLLNAAASLGAAPWLAFRKVALPIIFPGVFAGALFAFATSFDEVVVALLLTGPGQRTLPRQMFAGINDNISLTITAAGTLLIVLACVLMIAVGWLSGAARGCGKAADQESVQSRAPGLAQRLNMAFDLGYRGPRSGRSRGCLSPSPHARPGGRRHTRRARATSPGLLVSLPGFRARRARTKVPTGP